MGLLVQGRWHDRWYDTKSTGGRFVRQDSTFRDRVAADGSTAYPAQAGRYHLYVSLACPWAHRTLIVRKLKGLEDAIDVSVVEPFMGEHGWTFEPAEGGAPRTPGATGDKLLGRRFLHEVYTAADPGFSGRVTVPVLWDKETGTIVNNESSEIIRMLNSEFEAFSATGIDLCPEPLRPEIDRINALVYDTVNNGVYKAGFATRQVVHEEAVTVLFETLDALEERLSSRRWLVGERMTEADIRLFTTLVRFDCVYVGHFKCNLKRIADYPALSGYLRDIYQVPGIAETVDFTHIKRHYYQSHASINPTRIVPLGPIQDLSAPHGRERLSRQAPVP